LENTIEEYENNIISSTKVIERLIELAKEIRTAEKAGENLGLSEEELAFYDIIVSGKKRLIETVRIKIMSKESEDLKLKIKIILAISVTLLIFLYH